MTDAPTEEEILARFHRMKITIGLSATKFGYVTIGQPGLIKRLTEGHKLRPATRVRCGEALDELERGHSVPVPAASVNKNRTSGLDESGNTFLKKGKPAPETAARNEMED